MFAIIILCVLCGFALGVVVTVLACAVADRCECDDCRED